MKKSLLLVFGLALALGSCKKSSSDEATPAPAASGSSSIGAVPATFTQKVLIEEFTGTWCGWCPDGALKMESIIAAKAGKVIGASIHDGDPMEISLNNYCNSTFSVTSWPSAMVSRVPASGAPKAPMSRSLWAANADLRLAEVSKCGLAIKSSIASNDSVTVEVHAGFKETMAGNYNLVVYVLEDDVHGTGGQWPQHNYNNTTVGHPHYGMGDPFTATYYHDNVVRKVLTANAGDVIATSSIVAGGQVVKTYKFAVGTYDKTKLSIAAFVLKNGTSGTTYKIMNVQKSTVGSTKNWD